MADAILPDVRVAELKKACAAVLTCSVCYDKFVSHEPLTKQPQCDRCRSRWVEELHQIYGTDAR